jgi:predicted ATPase/transcriptional regulator with XRE-family HTH domain
MQQREVGTFGDLLRSYRERVGLTQEELAERAGLSAQGVSALERGLRRRPYLPTVRALADALGLTASERAAFASAVEREHSGRPESPPNSTGTAPSGNLPAPLTPLIGRERAVSENCALLRREDVRLVTLTGPGGVGKTRLAVQIAAELAADQTIQPAPGPSGGGRQAFADGAIFVPLATTRDADLFPSAIVTALGVPEVRGRRVTDVLVAHLRQRELLLVLDNFEQILSAAPTVTALLERCPRVKALVTSRARLLVSGERDMPVDPLDLPDPSDTSSPDDLLDYPATRLFLERAQAVNPRLAVSDADARAIAEICARVDGIPLAIELAAARVNILSPTALLTHLERRLPLLTGGPRDLPARLRTMRDAIAWSHALLEEGERALFRRLSVFVGGFTIEGALGAGYPLGAAQDESSVPVPPVPSAPSALPLLDGLASLVDKSLIRQVDGVESVARNGESRLRMLETIREYALEQLEESGEGEEVREQHAGWYLEFAQRVDAELEGPEMFRWLLRVEAEHANLRAAIQWFKDQGDTGAALRLGAGLSAFWWYRGHYGEGRAQLEGLLALPDARSHPFAWARAMTGLGTLIYKSGEVTRAMRLHEQAIEIWRELDDQERLGYALWCQGLAAGGTDDDLATAALLESFEIARSLDAPWLALPAWWALGRIARCRGDYREAETKVSDALRAARQYGHPIGLPLSLVVLGHTALDQGEIDRAASLFAECLDALREIGGRWGIAGRLKGLAAVAAAPWGVPACLEGLGAVAAARGDSARGARLFGTTAALRDMVGYAREPVDQPGFERWLTFVRNALDDEAFATAWAEGQTLSFDDAIGEALAVARGPDGSALPAVGIIRRTDRPDVQHDVVDDEPRRHPPTIRSASGGRRSGSRS